MALTDGINRLLANGIRESLHICYCHAHFLQADVLEHLGLRAFDTVSTLETSTKGARLLARGFVAVDLTARVKALRREIAITWDMVTDSHDHRINLILGCLTMTMIVMVIVRLLERDLW